MIIIIIITILYCNLQTIDDATGAGARTMTAVPDQRRNAVTATGQLVRAKTTMRIGKKT